MARTERSVSREAILEAVVRVVAREGLSGSSLSAIAREAGTSKPLVLYHFGTRSRLLREMSERVLDRLHRAMRARIAELEPNGPLLQAALEVVFDKDNRTLLAAVHAVKSLGARDPEVGACVRDAFDQLARMTVLMMPGAPGLAHARALVISLQGHIDLWLCSGDAEPGPYIDGALRVTRAMLAQAVADAAAPSPELRGAGLES